jgi:uncharacterized PurR-regulated membrane protein YhhQ (DUF165 family)
VRAIKGIDLSAHRRTSERVMRRLIVYFPLINLSGHLCYIFSQEIDVVLLRHLRYSYRSMKHVIAKYLTNGVSI